MAENEKKTIPSVEGMEAHIDTWRDIIKNKQRGIFAFDELAEIKLKALKKRIYTDFENTAPWKMRECIYKDIGDYEYLYDGWKDLDVGGYWGGNGLSSFFKNKITIPERFEGKKVTLYVYFGGDSLVSVNGVPFQGLDPLRPATHTISTSNPISYGTQTKAHSRSLSAPSSLQRMMKSMKFTGI